MQITRRGLKYSSYSIILLIYHANFSMKASLLYILSILFTANAFARQGNITGRVIDDGGKPVPFASVLLLRAADSSLVKTELTGATGEYQLNTIADGAFI